MSLRPNSKTPAERVRATRIRHKLREGEELGPDDAAFIESYEADAIPVAAVPVDASASTERVVHIEERKAAAQGNHPHPDAYAAIATAEGLRADTLLRITTQALIQANEQYRLMTAHLLERTTRIEEAHVSMLEAVRDNYLGRVEAEAQLTALANAASGEGGGDAGELVELLKFAMAARAQHVAGGGAAADKKRRSRKRKPLGAL